MKYRVEQLAAACDVSVDTIRFYQSKGLLQPPERDGRIAIYGSPHAERIRKIRSLQRKGLTLAAVARVVSGTLARPDADLAAAVAEAAGDDADLTLAELAERSGVPEPLLKAVEAEGITIGRDVDGQTRYSAADVDLVRHGLKLLSAGLPLSELLALARKQDAAAREVAADAVRMFDAHVRTPIKQSADNDEQAAAALVEAFRDLLPAVTSLVANHFRRVLLQIATEHIEATGDDAERSALGLVREGS